MCFGSIHYLWPGGGGVVRQNRLAKKSAPSPREYTEKNQPPTMTLS